MPELAEVETVRNTLKKSILHKKIKKIDILYKNIIENDLNYFIENLINEKFIDIHRKGKYLIFETNKNYLISHLRMEGKYFIKSINDPVEKHEHVIFHFDDIDLRYHDTRKFGKMKLLEKNQLDDYFKNLGPDANMYTDFNELKLKINKKRGPIKSILLDQSVIAGLGNIYADEVLYFAKIHPLKKGCDITLDEAKNILDSSRKILDKAIEYKGTTIKSYTSSLGVYGKYQNFLCVHTKKVCQCKENIKVIKVGGRTTYFCPKCQDNL